MKEDSDIITHVKKQKYIGYVSWSGKFVQKPAPYTLHFLSHLSNKIDIYIFLFSDRATLSLDMELTSHAYSDEPETQAGLSVYG